MPIDEIDRKIIHATQAGLPLVSEPYQAVAEQLGLSAQAVMLSMAEMQQTGVIRRIAAVPNHYKLGYRFNGMTVWDVDDNQVDALGRQVASLNFVSHCYQRPRHLPDWPYSLFAMVHGKTEQDADQQVAIIADLLGEHARSHEVLYSTKILKKTGLRIGG
ncbi:Heme d1 biosynthesis protein NirH [Methylomonas albis]|uniref:siroheme decarboxylase n=1 Tax=Methylomonas albis TaxID=1854563 RepID=A0ABR9CVM7_9GAMM|nr:AsnC family transcriptional regulator [Methylomonas albis]MBD9354899.1 Lrp/AsnC family transcriptional regulator [Methylomonas albis]CAD6877815.1 Heme d1 biosynthesis protein NirH [Methylomonas albis]